jgi:DNA-binding transcriptional ArsR family regulator
MDVDAVFHALGDSTRRALLERLSAGPCSVSHLAAPFPISLAAVVQHLQVMEQCGLVQTEKVGRVRTCSIAPGGTDAAIAWLQARRTPAERQLDRLGDHLSRTSPTEQEDR